MYRIPYENEQITKTIAAPYAPVDFTEEEKAQFRDNIGAGGGGVGAVRYDTAQSLTSAQQAQARENIGAGTDSASEIELLWENASLASSFPAQTINLDLSAYKFVLIVYKYGITSIGGTGGAIIMANGDYAKLIGLFNNKLSNRNVDLRTPNQVKFLGGDRNDEYGGADISDNRLIIPHKIYGMK